MSTTRAGARSDRTTRVSSSTPKATMKAIWARNARGMTMSAAKVAASTTPADVMTPPVLTSPRSTPCRAPCSIASSRTRDIRKML